MKYHSIYNDYNNSFYYLKYNSSSYHYLSKLFINYNCYYLLPFSPNYNNNKSY